MATTALSVTLSEFLRSSGKLLEQAEHHDLLLRRRDGADLMLVRADREQDLRDALAASTALLAVLAESETLRDQIAEMLTSKLPWLRFLPDEGRQRFVQDFVETAEACAALSSFDRLGTLIAQARNTAYVYSRPDLLDALTADSTFDAPIARPS